MTARERWEQALRDAWRASLHLSGQTDSEFHVSYAIGKALGPETCNQIVDEEVAESDRVSRSQPPVVGAVESQDRETPL